VFVSQAGRGSPWQMLPAAIIPRGQLRSAQPPVQWQRDAGKRPSNMRLKLSALLLKELLCCLTFETFAAA